MTAAKQPPRDVWGANQYEDIVKRALDWAVPFTVDAVKALKRDGRPLGTSRVSNSERISLLLEAGPEFWDALKSNDPESAAKLAADIIRARQTGKIPEQGPRVQEAESLIGEAAQLEVQQQQTGAPRMGTERSAPIAPAIIRGLGDTVA